MKSVDLGIGRVSKIFAKYAISSVLIMVTQTIAMMVDAVFVGKYVGPDGLSAITLFYPLVSLFIGVATMVAVGSNNLAGISLGNGNYEKSNDYFNIALRVILFFSTSLTLVGVLIMNDLASFLNVDGITRGFVVDYGMTINFFFVFFMVNMVLSYFVKLEGRPQRLMKIAIASVLSNIFLDYLLVAVFDWRMIGAALATGLSQVLFFILIMVHYLRHSTWKVHRKRLRAGEYFLVGANGSSQFLTEASYAISGFVLNSAILKLIGVNGIAGYSVAMQLTALFRSIGLGISEASRPGVSFNYGSKDFKRVRGFKHWADRSNIVFGLICFAVLSMWGGNLAGLFVSDQETIRTTVNILTVISVSYVVMGFNIGVKVYYTAIDAPKYAMFFTLYRGLFSVLLGLMVFTRIFGGQGIWYALLFKEFSSAFVAVLMYIVYPYGRKKRKLKSRMAS